MSAVIIVTGVTGQDGSHMVDYLLENTNHEIYGGVRRLSVPNHKNIEHVKSDRFKLISLDLTDSHSIEKNILKLKPDYFINFAAQSFVGASWDYPKQTFETNATAVLDILEAIKTHAPQCRFYNAGTSEEFGDIEYSPQDESHPLRPRSPYGASKAAARHLIKVYRESYDLYAVQGWLFNHEGVRRGEEFVTRKITKSVAKIKQAIDKNLEWEPLELGNLDAYRDWSDAEDFVDGVWKMVNQETPKDYVLSSGNAHTIREFVETAFRFVGIDGYWISSGIKERYKTTVVEQELVKINPKFYRPAEVECLLGNSEAARRDLNWEPKISFKCLVEKMVRNDQRQPE
ncbi:GDP-mannose 4,6-dehydratase [Candidatus Woesebacteria bacterium]|nr:GDP-mannose 4,6-dehydratase [Candidatus Woesebacteria bacterium]